MSKFKVGDRVSRVLCNGHTVRGMVESVYSKSIVVLGDNGEAYSILVDGTIKEDNMDEYKVTGEVIRKMAEKCPTARDVLKEGFPDAFKDEWEVMGADEIAFSPRESMTLADKKNGKHFWVILEGRINPSHGGNYKYDKNYFYRRVQ
jgi:ribosomal protein L21E